VTGDRQDGTSWQLRRFPDRQRLGAPIQIPRERCRDRDVADEWSLDQRHRRRVAYGPAVGREEGEVRIHRREPDLRDAVVDFVLR
jgi:hypothetical protein